MRKTLQKISEHVPSPWGRARVGVLFLLLPFTFYAQINTFPASGNVGIGTDTPSAKLHIVGDLYMNQGEGFKIFGDSNYFGQYLDGIIFQMEDGNASNGNTDGGFVFRGYSRTDALYKNWMVIKAPGRVGIGTLNPDAELTVKGKIHTQEVKVDLAGAVAPDYVFKEDYHLRSLEEVQAHIKEKGHLPGIPSAEEMEEEGVNLKEMNLKLLEKVEELTLYTLQQQTDLSRKDKRINDLESRLETLEKLILNKN
ncbi:hypothetical protein [Sinomicrobium sp. M5D2P9]